MRLKTRQIAFDFDPNEHTVLDPPLESERVRRLIALMAAAIVALVEPMRRTNDDND